MSLRVVGWLLASGMVLSACASAGSGPRPNPFPNPPSPPAIYPKPLNRAATSFSTASFVAAARQLSGVPYRLGGESPASGFDCSGYVRYVFGLFRVALPRTVAEQWRIGRPAKSRAILAGDLLFFETAGHASGVTHVALALGPDEFIHAPAESGAVRTEKLSSPYWRTRFVGARRIL